MLLFFACHALHFTFWMQKRVLCQLIMNSVASAILAYKS